MRIHNQLGAGLDEATDRLSAPGGPDEVSIFDDAALYDAQYHTLTKDIRFYEHLARESGGPVLELAVGTGRISQAILALGIALTGLDASPSMLKAAGSRLRPFDKLCHLAHGSYAHFRFSRKFALIFCAFNSLQHAYGWQDLVQVLQCVRRHLKPEGLFAFDLFNPHLHELKDRATTPQLRERFFDERNGQTCEVWETYEYDCVTQIKVAQWEYRWPNGQVRRGVLRGRIYHPQELLALLALSGFRVIRHWGDFNGSPFDRVSAKQIFVCQPVRA